MGAVTVTVRVMDDAGTPAPIDGVTIRVFTDTDIFITEGDTGNPVPGSGEVELTLDGDAVGVPYVVRPYKEGVSFLPAPVFPISVTDPPAPDNEFEFIGRVGMTGQLVELFVKSNDLVPVAIEDMRVRVFDASDTFLFEAFTDVDGAVSAVLEGSATPGTEYLVRFLKSLYSIENGPTQKIEVLDPVVPPDTNVFDFTAVSRAVPQSSDPDLCLLYGYLIDLSGRPLANKELKFVPQPYAPEDRVGGSSFPHDPAIISGRMISSGSCYNTNAAGYVEVLLPRGSIVDVVMRGLDTMYNLDQQLAQIYVPDEASAQLEDVLFPYIAVVEYGSDPIVATAGETTEVSLLVVDVTGRAIEGATVINTLLTFESLDPSIATVNVTGEGVLSVVGVGVGSTTFQVYRVDRTYALRRPAVPALVTNPPTITVS